MQMVYFWPLLYIFIYQTKLYIKPQIGPRKSYQNDKTILIFWSTNSTPSQPISGQNKFEFYGPIIGKEGGYTHIIRGIR